MKRFSIILLLLAGICVAAPGRNNPEAAPGAVVVSGNARFTVLTDRLIRMEWAEDGVFEDRATLAIVNRNLPVPGFRVSEKNGVLTISTGKVTITYSGGRFAEGNLRATFRMGGRNVSWTPASDPSGNLKGTSRTLDGCKGFAQLSSSETRLENGILSRDGWAVVDESERHVLEKNGSDWGEWVAERPGGDRLDLYLFAYGHDYKAALKDFTLIAGNIPLPPKYTLGYWWSRYWAYTDRELLELAAEMRSRRIPIDVFIVDMDWHETWQGLDARYGKDAFGEPHGWTGYTWNRDLFPDPEGFLKELHGMGYKTSLNLHPASGIGPYEDCYSRMVGDYTSRTSDYDGPPGYVYPEGGYTFTGNSSPSGRAGYHAPVPFRMDQMEWADAYFASVIHPLERQGVDFWWLDWQQWKESRYVSGLSNTFWLNYTFFQDKVRRSAYEGLSAARPLIYHRWGGLGSHRYQLGFSGDTYCEWSVLEFLPYFTATASNVGYGYWGHDIGGHMQPRGYDGPTDPEMFTRWLQYGVFTPIFKTHSTSSASLERRIWEFPDHYACMKAAIELRYALSPYVYTAAREAFDTGISICRPLYYDWPEEEKAYTMNQEFMFGNDILATVLCQPMKDGKTERKMWFPGGSDWYDMARHAMMKGGTSATLYYSIDENPWFVRAGSVIPLAGEGIQNLQEPSDALRLLVVPGNGKSSAVLYEDDGATQAYTRDFAFTRIAKSRTSSAITVTVGAREGSFSGMLPERKVTILLEGVSKAPKKVLLNGAKADAEIVVSGYSVAVKLPAMRADASNTVSITL